MNINKINSTDLPPDMLEKFLLAGLTQSDSYSKALANYMFREIIEDAHVKYDISQEDMKAMCKSAVNRAALYIALTRSERPTTMPAFAIHAAACDGWDDSETTAEIEKEMDLIADCEKLLMRGRL